MAYNFNKDRYERLYAPACRTVGACGQENNDLAHPVWKDGAYRFIVLIKNWSIKNAFKTNISPHVDVTQVLDSPGWGGWFVVQDSAFNSYENDGLVVAIRLQRWFVRFFRRRSADRVRWRCSRKLDFGQEDAFNADCLARPGAGDGCGTGNNLGSWNGPNEGWFINYRTNGWKITLQQSWKKVVLVGNIPDFQFRSDNSGYNFSIQQTCSSGACSFGGKGVRALSQHRGGHRRRPRGTAIRALVVQWLGRYEELRHRGPTCCRPAGFPRNSATEVMASKRSQAEMYPGPDSPTFDIGRDANRCGQGVRQLPASA